jgi:AcrR family transcriptional regulator
MPHIFEASSRTATVVTAINHVLATQGAGGLTMRTIGKVSGVNPASLAHHYGNREHMLRVAAARTGEARLQDMDARRWDEGVLAFLPGTADDIVSTRVWLGWVEIWRSDDTIAHTMREHLANERALLAKSIDYRLAREGLDALFAVIEGLRVAVCLPTRPLPLPRARQILENYLRQALAEAA